MILKGKCEIVEMLMGLRGPFKGNLVFPRTLSRGGKCPETSEGCLLELGGLGPQRPHAHMECAWECLEPGSPERVAKSCLPECKIKAGELGV